MANDNSDRPTNHRPTMSTGGIAFPVKSRADAPTNKGTHCHILVAADFSGRKNCSNEAQDPISKRKIIEVDRDNFDDVFESMQVSLELPIADNVIRFNELDDMNPDTLYEQISLFDKLRSLKARLKGNDSFQKAADELTHWMDEAGKTIPSTGSSQSNAESTLTADDSTDVLDALLSASGAQPKTPESGIEALAKSLVGPFLSNASDPRQADMLAAVDEATSELMRKVIHVSCFKQLESTWRSLYLLVKRLETNKNLKLFIVDVSKSEAIPDATSHEKLEDTQLYRLIVDNRKASGGKPFSLIMADYPIIDNHNDICLLGALGGIGEALNASCLIGANSKLAGCKDIFTEQDVADWSYSIEGSLSEAWQNLRESSVARYLSLVAPTYMARVPYGKKSSRTQNFNFEELPSNNDPSYYLWSNGAWLVTLLMASNYMKHGWRISQDWEHQVSKLPYFAYDNDGESEVMPSAQIYMTDKFAATMRESGLTVIRSVLNSDSVLIPAFTCLSNHTDYLEGAIVYK